VRSRSKSSSRRPPTRRRSRTARNTGSSTTTSSFNILMDVPDKHAYCAACRIDPGNDRRASCVVGSSAKLRALLATYRNDLRHPPIRMTYRASPFVCRNWWFESISLQRRVVQTICPSVTALPGFHRGHRQESDHSSRSSIKSDFAAIAAH
jgi:hypothetical protein